MNHKAARLLTALTLATCPAAIAQAQITAPAPEDQSSVGGAGQTSDIIVTARRRDERLQDVPLSIDAVTADRLERLNIRRFEDIQTVVPGLNLGTGAGGLSGGGSPGASLRGIAFNQLASGSNATVEFYLNDTPITASDLFTAIYDVGQIEVLRGPQGTLRGRASPSGSITVTTRRPDLDQAGGYVLMTGTSIGGLNGNGAINLPLIDGVLAVRAAGIIDDNANDRIKSINNGRDPHLTTWSGRASVRFEPTESLAFDFVYQHRDTDTWSYDQVESASEIDPLAPASPVLIRAGDRRAVEDAPRKVRGKLDHFDLRARWSVFGQALNYAGSRNKTKTLTQDISDQGDFFRPGSPAFLQSYGQFTDTRNKSWSHEVRLNSDERLFGIADYIVGGFYRKVEAPTNLRQATAILIPAPVPGNPGRIVSTPIARNNETQEKSVFGNLTIHLGSRTELSGGLRYIDYKADAGVVVNGAALAGAAVRQRENATIYTASFKHNFTENLMAYASTGSSWRPGLNVVGDFSLAPSALELSFVVLPAERSKSYEIGMKADLMDRRMTFNVSAFHQTFDNYPFRSTNGVYFVETALNTSTVPPSPFPRVSRFNFVGAVPVKVNGVEVQWTFAPDRNWNFSANGSYAKSKIKNGQIPCNDYFPRDGVPDASSAVPTLAQIRGATGGDTISACNVSYRASTSPLWSGNVQGEHHTALSDSADGYIRGLVSVNGRSLNDPTNPFDDVKAYALLNLYAGLRDPIGAWEVSLYGKNITGTDRVLSRTQSPLTTTYNVLATATNGISTYRGISLTAPREFGLTVRYAFGSR